MFFWQSTDQVTVLIKYYPCGWQDNKENQIFTGMTRISFECKRGRLIQIERYCRQSTIGCKLIIWHLTFSAHLCRNALWIPTSVLTIALNFYRVWSHQTRKSYLWYNIVISLFISGHLVDVCVAFLVWEVFCLQQHVKNRFSENVRMYTYFACDVC